MIVPTSRSLIFTGILILVMIGFSARPMVLLPVFGFYIVVLMIDALGGRKGFVDLQASLPAVVRFSKKREGIISVVVRNASSSARTIRVGLPLPAAFDGDSDLWLHLPQGSEYSRADFSCIPSSRGKFRIDRIHMEFFSPLKLWSIRQSRQQDCEIRVYPNLSEERRRLSALFLNRGDFGIHSRRLVGQGREFEKLREYIPGDAYDQIFWKATARRGKPITKVYQIEKTQEVYVVIDYSRLSGRKTGEETNLEFYIRSALILGLIAQQQGDLFGLLAFADRIGNFIRAGNGKAHYHICRDAIYTLEPRLATPDFRELFPFLRLRLRRRALLVVLTDLSDPVLAEQFMKGVDLIARQHLVLVNMMRPPRAQPLFAQQDARSIDDVYQKLGGHLLWQNLRELENQLHLHGAKLTQLEDADFTANIVTQYLNIKQRQLL